MANLPSWLNINTILGDTEKFSLEERIFNAFCATAVIALFLEIFFNYYIGLEVVALICLFGSAFSGILYYLSRYKRNTKVAIRSLGVVANFTFLLNYFFNSGIYGPNMVLFCLILLITIVVVPKKELALWITLNLVTVFGVLLFEYLNPEMIPEVYKDNLAKTVDFGVTYFVAALLICLSITFIRNSYDKERNIVFVKNQEIENQNSKILQQNKTLEKLNSEKAKLFSIVAHDIRSPLSSILGYLEVLAEADLTKIENDSVKQRLLYATKDTLEMLSNVLAWSKSQLGGTRVDIIAVNVGEELRNGLNLEKDIALRKNIDLEVRVTEELIIAADINMFQLVMRNLVNNAIKFTPEGGKVILSADKNSTNCFVRVKDNGVGISEEEQANLFKLKALSTFGTNNEKGVGLGLLLCKEFTELQNGKIWYERNEDTSSTFVVSFALYGVDKGSEI